ncbi:DELTA-sagatoxin-Srs1a [Maylandia zebra]|uniref:DELTA-sagatoxin-Srs1a n=1 Tax=Maylandia zebra TaxID=106582 RepID=UPI00403CE43A
MGLPTHRQCSIEIQNKTTTFTLCNPRMHIVSGSCSSPLPPTLSPYENGNALFIKKPHTACGSVTVFTYDLQHVSTLQFNGRVAVMFSVPYDFNFYSNWYAVGVFDMDKACDQHLYDEMYNKSEQKFVRGKAKGPSLAYRGAYITVRATMSDTYQPILKVAICNN